MNRRDFFRSAKPKFTGGMSVVASSSALSGLAPYTGSWSMNEVSHLLRRTMFGATKADIDHFLNLNVSDAVDELLVNSGSVTPPLRDYGVLDLDDGPYNDALVSIGQTWINDINKITDPGIRSAVNNARMDSLRKWWVGIMINQQRSIGEKMILFWHHHFSVQKEEVSNCLMVYRHHDLLRQNALGNIRQLTKDVSTDPAMLIHLNGYLNTKVAPDENYARELQELFTVGRGTDSLYTEDDVIAAARVLTGWRVDDNTLTSFLDEGSHDTGSKSFSAFYNNTTIAGSSNAQQELDAFINMIFATQECPKFICRKLYRWFVSSVIDNDTETNVIAPLSEILRNNNFEIKPVLETLFKSEHFFDAVTMACYIKSPYDFIIGTIREFGVPFPAYTDHAAGYPLFYSVYKNAADMQQDLFQPPDVSGWPAYHQEPMFYELWVNSNSLPRRADFTDALFTDNLVNVKTFASMSSAPGDPNQLIDDITAMLLRYPLSSNSKLYVKNNYLINNSGDDTVWTNIWNSNDNSVIVPALKNLYKFLTNLPEYHLS